MKRVYLCCEHWVISKFENSDVKKPLNLDRKFAELTIKDGIARGLS